MATTLPGRIEELAIALYEYSFIEAADVDLYQGMEESQDEHLGQGGV